MAYESKRCFKCLGCGCYFTKNSEFYRKTHDSSPCHVEEVECSPQIHEWVERYFEISDSDIRRLEKTIR